MPKCTCKDERHGHGNPCGREATVETDNFCSECRAAENKAGEQWRSTISGHQGGEAPHNTVAPRGGPVLTEPPKVTT